MAIHHKRAKPQRGRGSKSLRGKRRKFETSRLKDVSEGNSSEDEAEDVSRGPVDELDGSEGSDISSGSDLDEQPDENSYSTLLKLLHNGAKSDEPARKRRKIRSDTPHTAQHETSVQDDGDVEAVDELAVMEPSDEENMDDDVSDQVDGYDNSGNDGRNDPFESHFGNPDESELSQKIEASSKPWRSIKSDLIEGMYVVAGSPDAGHATCPVLPSTPTPANLKLKQKLARNAVSFDPLSNCLTPYIFGYHDILFCSRTTKNSAKLRDLYCLHALNHVLKTRDRVIKNSATLSKEDGGDIELSDQGFTRPKVLMILPTRQACVRVIDSLSKLYPTEQQENKKRFMDSFSAPDNDDWVNKTEDFKELFGGNDDDMFRLGLKFTRKSLKYFSQFYSSDIILASPLGLRTAIEKEGGKRLENDFLSSIEMVIVDHADALIMQNWEHVEYVFSNLNLQPKEAHGCDFSRVRKWYLDGHGKYIRQTLVFSAFITPELNALYGSQMQNIFGKAKIIPKYDGAILNLRLLSSVKQTFSRFDSLSPLKDPEARFQYFTRTVLTNLSRNWTGPNSGKGKSGGTLIFIPSYLDFVRVRNYFANSTQTANISFGLISEYTSVRDSSKARSHFMNDRHSVLLYTERAHHFRRYNIRGVSNIVMYGLPDNPMFWSEIVEYLGSGPGATAAASGPIPTLRVLFSKWDAFKLERIVGTTRVRNMLLEKGGDTFTFV
ncbi:digestive organ expansion factor [Arthroderma uncinatum]|uniref:digestive organ expansion factor n=1 Tax=Arthroderma uncinatum TaxID=74035 RepID=UPI00144A5A8B|nr:digestive organ expansion factor [Arthroderma uncinatum]KAF3480283.1 digestive organ expansion factor [Arthroderma uncinatum]